MVALPLVWLLFHKLSKTAAVVTRHNVYHPNAGWVDVENGSKVGDELVGLHDVAVVRVCCC